MGRLKIKDEDKKLKFGISLDPKLYKRIKKEHSCLDFKNILGLKEKYEILKNRNKVIVETKVSRHYACLIFLQKIQLLSPL
jgi:hypothetical protein